MNDMQTSPPSQKEPFSFFWSKMTRNVLNWMKSQFSDFRNFYFLRYNRSKIEFFLSIWLKKKRCAMIWNGFLSYFFVRSLVFVIWSILHFTFVMHSWPRRILKKKIMLGGLRFPKPPVFVRAFAPNTPLPGQHP